MKCEINTTDLKTMKTLCVDFLSSANEPLTRAADSVFAARETSSRVELA